MKKTNLVAALAVLGFAVSSSAVPITGTLGFSGDASAVGGTGFADATGIDAGGNGAAPGVIVTLGPSNTGDFAGFGPALGLMHDITFSPSTPATPLWVLGPWSFDLLTISVANQDANNITLVGVGTVFSTIIGKDPTPGKWSFSIDRPDTSSPLGTFTFSANSVSPFTVPDAGSTLALLGGVVLAAAGAARRKLA